MKQAGYVVFDWDVDSGDSKRVGVPAKEIVQSVKEAKLGDTINVLMHDSTGHGETVKALPEIIAYYKSKGYTFEALTAETEPVQFRIADRERWQRTAVSKAWISENIVPVKTENEQTPMRFLMTTSAGDVAFEPGEHMLLEETTYIPVRALVEQLGGSIQYDAASASYKMELNSVTWSIDKKGGVSSMQKDGTVKALEWQAEREQNMFWVPLRDVLEHAQVKLFKYELIPVQAE